MFPELPPVLRGDPLGGTGGGIFSLITTAFCRNGGRGAAFAFLGLRDSLGLLGLAADVDLVAPAAVCGAAAAAVGGPRLPMLFLDDDDVNPMVSKRFSTFSDTIPLKAACRRGIYA